MSDENVNPVETPEKPETVETTEAPAAETVEAPVAETTPEPVAEAEPVIEAQPATESEVTETAPAAEAASEPVADASPIVDEAPVIEAQAPVAEPVAEETPTAAKPNRGKATPVVEEPVVPAGPDVVDFGAKKPLTRGRRRVRVGKVISNKMQQTVVVSVETRVRHPLYGKFMRRTTKFKAHDEENACGEGDTVEIMETRPLSKDKRWRVVQIVEKAK